MRVDKSEVNRGTSCLGICCALSAEARTLTDREISVGEVVTLDNNTLLALSGMGAERARNAATQLIDRGASALVSWGVAAALDETLIPGSLVLPQAVLSAAGKRLSVHRRWHTALCSMLSRTLDINTGILIETPEILTDAPQKRELSLTHGAIASDMETVSTAETATRAGVAFIAIRAISDTVSMTVPEGVIEAVNPVGKMSLEAIFTTIILHPSDWPSIAKLALGMRAACASLEKVRKYTDMSLLVSQV